MSAIDQAKEHIWRGLAMTKLLKELGWVMQQHQHDEPTFVFVEMNPEAFRYVVTILADELEHVISYLDQLKAAELDAADARAPAHERQIIGLANEPNKEQT
jgi:hypothetical protein